MSKEIRILVVGDAAVGKSALAMEIHNCLQAVGIDSTLVDDNGIGVVDERPGVIAKSLDKRINAIGVKGTKVTVQTMSSRPVPVGKPVTVGEVHAPVEIKGTPPAAPTTPAEGE